MTITELTDLLFHDADSLTIFMKGVTMQALFELTGLGFAALRTMKNNGNA